MYGPARLAEDLRSIGHKVDEVRAPDGTAFVVLRPFEIECGRFVGRVIELGLQGTADFPRSVAAAIHVRAEPQLLEFSDSIPNVRNITRSALGPDWRYWSHNFGWQGERSARRLMSQINRIFVNV